MPYLEKSVADDPDFAFAWDNLGFVQFKLGKPEEGLASVDKSLTLDKGNSYAYKNKGIIFMEVGKRVEALQQFQLALRYGYTQRYGNEVLELIKQLG